MYEDQILLASFMQLVLLNLNGNATVNKASKIGPICAISIFHFPLDFCLSCN